LKTDLEKDWQRGLEAGEDRGVQYTADKYRTKGKVHDKGGWTKKGARVSIHEGWEEMLRKKKDCWIHKTRGQRGLRGRGVACGVVVLGGKSKDQKRTITKKRMYWLGPGNEPCSLWEEGTQTRWFYGFPVLLKEKHGESKALLIKV